MNRFKRILSIAACVLMVLLTLLLLAGSVLFLLVATTGNQEHGTAVILGYRMYLTDDPSITSSMKNHSFILAKNIEPQDVKDGMLITYTLEYPGGQLVTQTRRVVNVAGEEGAFTFSMENDSDETVSLITQDQIKNMSVPVFSSSKIGSCLLFFYAHRTVCMIVFYLVLAALLAGCIVLLWRQRTPAPAASPPEDALLPLEQLVSREQDVVFEKSTHPKEDLPDALSQDGPQAEDPFAGEIPLENGNPS